MNFREERRGALARGAGEGPGRNHSSRRLREGSSGGDHSSPSSSTSFHPGFGGAGRGRRQGGGVSYRARQLLSVRSCKLHAVISQLFVTSPERDQIARASRRTLVRLGKKDGRNLSVWRERGTRILSRRELALSLALKSSAPLFFPHRSLGGRKREGARGGVAL